MADDRRPSPCAGVLHPVIGKTGLVVSRIGLEERFFDSPEAKQVRRPVRFLLAVDPSLLFRREKETGRVGMGRTADLQIDADPCQPVGIGADGDGVTPAVGEGEPGMGKADLGGIVSLAETKEQPLEGRSPFQPRLAPGERFQRPITKPLPGRQLPEVDAPSRSGDLQGDPEIFLEFFGQILFIETHVAVPSPIWSEPDSRRRFEPAGAHRAPDNHRGPKPDSGSGPLSG